MNSGTNAYWVQLASGESGKYRVGWCMWDSRAWRKRALKLGVIPSTGKTKDKERGAYLGAARIQEAQTADVWADMPLVILKRNNR